MTADPLRPLIDGLRAFPHDELVAGLRVLQRAKQGDLSLEELRRGPLLPEPVSAASPSAALRFLLLVDEAKDALRPDAEAKEEGERHQRARQRLMTHERLTRRSVDRVDRLLDAVRRHDKAEAQRTTLLPQELLVLEGPARGICGGRVRLANGRATPVVAGFETEAFRGREDQRLVNPRVSFEPAAPTIPAGESLVVRVLVDFSETDGIADETVDGEVVVTLAEEPALRLALEVRLHDA
ncbi:hypothetical protein OAX78_01775 [Planctomycetota bacterium]|nr:hypothetical protein [Planctomycetota bacterium]